MDIVTNYLGYCIMLGVILGFWFLHCQQHRFFEFIEDYYCKKYHGDCYKCNAWSCRRKKYIYDYKEEDLNE